MSSIHLLGSIINDLENELAKYAKKKDASEHIIKARQSLIQQLSDVYDGYKRLTMWDVFEQIQHDIDAVVAKDSDLTCAIIVVPLKPVKFNSSKCAFIDYTERDVFKPIIKKTYLDSTC